MKLNRSIVVLAFVILLAACSSEKEKLVAQIKTAETGLMNDTSLVVNPEKGKSVKELYLKFVEQFPQDTLSGTYLFKAADLSNGMRDPNTAVELLGRLLTKYPNHPRCASALFMQAFIYDTELHSPESAKAKYKEFVQRFPNDVLAPSAQATLQQLEMGISDEELVKKFQMMNDSLNSAN